MCQTKTPKAEIEIFINMTEEQYEQFLAISRVQLFDLKYIGKYLSDCGYEIDQKFSKGFIENAVFHDDILELFIEMPLPINLKTIFLFLEDCIETTLKSKDCRIIIDDPVNKQIITNIEDYFEPNKTIIFNHIPQLKNKYY